MKNNFWKTSKKALSVFLSVLMLMTCWVWVAPEKAEAANIDISYPLTMQFDVTDDIANGGHILVKYYKLNDNGTVDMSTSYDYYLTTSLGGDGYSGVKNDYQISRDIPGWPYSLTISVANNGWDTDKLALNWLKIGNRYVFNDNWTVQDNQTVTFAYNNSQGSWSGSTAWFTPSWAVNSTLGGATLQVPAYGTRTSGSLSASFIDSNYGVAWPQNLVSYSINGSNVNLSSTTGSTTVSVTSASASNITDATGFKNLTLTASGAGKTSTSTIRLNAPTKEILYENLFSLSDWYYSDSSKWSDGNVKTDVNAGTIAITNPTTDSSTEYTTNATTGALPSNHYSFPVTAGKTYYFVCDTANATDTEVFFMYKDQNNTGLSYPSVHFHGNGRQVAEFTAPAYAAKAEIRFDNNTNGTTATFSNIGIYEKEAADKVDLLNWSTRPVRKVYTYNTSSAASAGLDKPVRPGYKFNGWINADGSVYTAKTMNANRTVYSTWTAIPYDIGYDNLFSLAEWSNTNSNKVNNLATGLNVDLGAGTIAVTGKEDAYTIYGGGSDQYHVPVTAGEEYIFDYDAASTNGTYQAFVFFYNDAGEGVTGAILDGTAQTVPHIGFYNGNPITFTVPAGCTKIGIRIGVCGTTEGTATYSNIGIYKKADYDAYAKNYQKVREPFYYGDTTELMKNPTREGYVFDGWYTADDVKIENVAGLAASGTVYAKWTQLLEVKFVNEDGTVLKTEYVAPGAAATPPTAPTKNPTAEYEYKFSNWDKSYENITAATTIKAVYSEVAHDLRYIIEENATCDTNALVTKYCGTCEFNFGGAYRSDLDEHKKLGHDHSEVVKNTSTGVDGTHDLKCSRCDSKITQAHNFQLDANQSASDATCKLPGETYYICACTQTKTEYGATNPNNHVNKYTKADTVIAETCFNEGYTGDIWCSDCNKKVADGTVVPQLEHVYTSYTYNNNETCFADGTETAKCDHGCGTEATRDKANTKLTHEYTNYVSNGDAKCEVNGTETAKCDHGCGTEHTRTDEGSARAHIFEGTIKDNKDGTHSYECTYDDCTVYGGTVACSDWSEDGANCKCDDCGYTKAHAWGNWKANADNTGLAAGKMTRECTVCGADEESECNYVVTNHSDATCTSPERTTYECSDCKHGYTAIGAAATGHDYTGEVKSDGKGYHNFLCNNGCGTYGYNGTQNAMTACTYKYDNEAAGTHKVYCEVCPYTFSEDCTGGNATCTDLAVCENCDTAYGEKAAHDLTGTEKYLKKATDATCTANETYYKYCVNCEGEFSTETYEKPDSMLPHTYTGNTWYDGAELAAEAKCEVNEKYYVYCSECKASSKGTAEEATFEKEGTALEHSYYGAITCNNDGTHTINCERDGCTSTVTGSCLEAGLTYGLEPATCTEQGYTKYQCGVCNYTWEDDFVDPLGHNYTEKLYKDTHLKEAANCEHANIYWYDCSRCDKNAKDETDTDKYTVLTFTSGNIREHKWINEVADEYLADEATCFAAAKYYTSCEYEDCGKSSLEVLDAAGAVKFSHGAPLAHDWKEVEDAKYLATPADCITDATYYYECSACKNSSKDYGNGSTWTDEGSKSGHALTHHEAAEETCEVDGNVEYWSCSRCNKNFGDDQGTTEIKDVVLEAPGHDWVKYAFKNATCEEDGHNAYEECSRCKVKKDGYTVYPKTGHDFTGAWTYDSVYNYHSKFCLNECGASGFVIDGEQVKYTVEYDGLDYTFKGGEACVFTGEYRNYEDENGIHSHALKCVCGNETSEACEDAAPETVAPTCTEEGYTLHICDTCSYEWKTDIEAASGHDLADEATSNNDGTHSVKCSVCDYEEQRAKCSGGTATCSAKAECSVCGSEYGEKGDHVLADDKWTSNGDAKCGVNGTESQNCSACGEKVTRTEEGSALSHEMKDYGYDLSDWDGMPADFDETSIKAPTCKLEGKAITYCTREGCSYHKTKIVQKDASGHSFEGEWINVGGDCSTGITFIRECANGCGMTESKVETVDHAWENVLVVDSTCITKGYKKQECTNCGFTQTVYDSNWDENKDNLHQMSDWETLTEATCCEAEVEFSVCSICGLEQTREGDEKATGHNYDEVNPENNNLVKWIEYPATCDTAGYIEHYRDAHGNCFVKNEAGEFVKADIVIPAGHADKNTDDVCDRCSAHLSKDENGEISGAHSCLCHKTSFFMKLIYKIFRFFWKIFGINKTCACGIAHY